MVVGTWLKNVGESVAQNEPLLEITTDKVTVEIAAPATGVLREILKSADQPIQAGEVLGRIEVGAVEAAGRAKADGAAPAREPTAAGAPAAAELTAAVRRLLAEHGLEPSAISGTGRGGRNGNRSRRREFLHASSLWSFISLISHLQRPDDVGLLLPSRDLV